MVAGNRRILADHMFMRYFDLGMNFMPVFSADTLYSRTSIIEVISSSLQPSTDAYCIRVANKLFAFAQSTNMHALEILSYDDDEYHKVISDLGYTCADSRYDLVPVSINHRPRAGIVIQAAIPSEYNKCYELGAQMWIARTGIYSLAEAYEAIRMGRACSPRVTR